MDLAFAAHAAPFTQHNTLGAVKGAKRRNPAYRTVTTERRRSRIVSQEAPVEFVEAAEPLEGAEQGTPVKDEKKVRLQALMSKYGVASSETCAVMIENGFVSVNGEVVTDAKARVKKDTDFILVRGKELLPFDPDDGSDNDDDESVENLPRAQKDFGRAKVLSTDKFNWRVDGGFLSSKAGGRIR